MKNWTEYKLIDVLQFSHGKAINANEQGDYKVYGSNGIIGFSSQFKYEKAIIIGRVGAYCGATSFEENKFWASDNAIVANAKSGFNIKYLSYLLKSFPLNEYAGGSAQPLVNQGVLGRITAKIPSFPTQQRIASILSAYDDLIEVNSQRIKLLEETARELYKEWFVRMRFPPTADRPGYKQAKFVKGVPEGWEVVRIGDLIKIKNGKEGQLTHNGLYKVYGSNGQIGFANKFNYEDVLIIGRVGAYCGSIEIGNSKIWATDNTLVAVPNIKRAGFFFSYYLLKTLDLGNFAGGSAQPLLTQSIINRLKILAPSQFLVGKYEMITNPMFQQMEILQQQNTHLRQIRDRLLSRLISGKLEVKEK